MTADAASPCIPETTPPLSPRGRFRKPVLPLTAVLTLALPVSVLLASPVFAQPPGPAPAARPTVLAASASPPAPIPGSPLDAYDKQVPYDVGAHGIARLAAIIAYALMTATVLLGAVLRLRYFQRVVNRATVYGAHMTLALAALIFGGIHGVAFLYQPVWGIGPGQLLVPFSGGLQRVPVGLGILGTELAVAVGCSVWLQRRLGYRRWLRFHQLGYPAFALIWLHIITVHPEPRHFDLVAVGVAAGAGACLLAFMIRVLPSRSRLRQRAFAHETDVLR